MRREGDGCPKVGNGGMIATRWGEMGEGGMSTGWRLAPVPHRFGTAALYPRDWEDRPWALRDTGECWPAAKAMAV